VATETYRDKGPKMSKKESHGELSKSFTVVTKKYPRRNISGYETGSKEGGYGKGSQKGRLWFREGERKGQNRD
jgi:hypothetical protein